MRCCVKTIVESKHRTIVGAVLPCKWCSATMVVGDDELWRWTGERP